MDLGIALGGPYVAVHLRRRDFLYGHSGHVPSIEGAAHQLKRLLIRKNLTTLFVATDAPNEGEIRSTVPHDISHDLLSLLADMDNASCDRTLNSAEYEELQLALSSFEVQRFVPTQSQLIEFGDGGWTIIDQWICAHAR